MRKENDGSAYFGKMITTTSLDDSELKIGFSDGTKINISDAGQCCCEHRYITCDDDVSTLIGKTLTGVMTKDGPGENCDYDSHDTAFVEVQTSGGFITMTPHNVHNGYYGGFHVVVRGDNNAQ